jgi:hypothetical protein
MAEVYSLDAVDLAANGLFAKTFGSYVSEVLRHHGGECRDDILHREHPGTLT